MAPATDRDRLGLRVGRRRRAEERVPQRSLQTTVEFYTAALLHGVGVPRELFTTSFAVSRVGGWTAHALEQLEDNRLVRPRAEYVGEKGRSWVPVGER